MFSSLVTRIFGVKRDMDEFSTKNMMKVRSFFQSFPSLYPFILSELECVANIIKEPKHQGCLDPAEAALYPVLILLAKLRPSPVTTGMDEYDVSAFFIL